MTYNIDGFRYLPRQDGEVNGRIGQYEFYVSTDGVNWGSLVATGTFANDATEKTVSFAAKTGRYIRLRSLSEVNNNPWTSVAEINVLGTAQVNQPPDGVINSPASNVSITAGQSVSFAGTGTDPDNNLPLTYRWNFGAGSGIPDSTAKDPGSVQFNTAGTYTVSFTVTDALGLSDATPATRSVTVAQGNQPPDGVINSPASNVSITVGQSVSFAGTGTDPDNNLPLTYRWNFGTGSGIPDSTAKDPGSVQFNTAGTYTVSFTVTDALGVSDATPATRTVIVLSAGQIPQTGWSLKYDDSQELVGENGAAVNAFDGNVNTIWHTKWYGGSTALPHEIQIDLGLTYNIAGFRYLPRQDGEVNGRIGQYEFYVSTDGVNWGSLVATGTFVNNATEKTVSFTAKTGRYIRLRSLSEVNNNPWTSVAEINVLGTAQVNQPPDGVINSPASNVSITAGQSVSFAGTGTDPDNNLPLTYRWNFGAGSGIPDSTAKDPGSVQFNTAGTYTVSFTVTDALGLSDATPATRSVTVAQVNQPPDGVINSPASNVSITAGQSVSFAGTGTDPDNNLPLTYRWNFGAGSGIPDSTAKDPGSVQFNTAGTYTVSFTVTDASGLSDATPATRSVTVAQVNQPPDGVINSPASNVSITAGQSVSFAGTGTDPDNNLPLTYRWNFGAGSGIPDSTAKDPGSVQFNTAGTYTVSFTVTDASGLSDATPATRSVTVAQVNQPPDGVINSPASNVSITAGQSVSFAGTGTDPDNNLPLTYRWNFGTESGIPDSTAKDPGSVQFNTAGTYTVSFTVTDASGLSDATPATRSVTVAQVNQPPDGVINSFGQQRDRSLRASRCSFTGDGNGPGQQLAPDVQLEFRDGIRNPRLNGKGPRVGPVQYRRDLHGEFHGNRCVGLVGCHAGYSQRHRGAGKSTPRRGHQ